MVRPRSLGKRACGSAKQPGRLGFKYRFPPHSQLVGCRAGLRGRPAAAETEPCHGSQGVWQYSSLALSFRQVHCPARRGISAVLQQQETRGVCTYLEGPVLLGLSCVRTFDVCAYPCRSSQGGVSQQQPAPSATPSETKAVQAASPCKVSHLLQRLRAGPS